MLDRLPGYSSGHPLVIVDTETDGLRRPYLEGGRRAWDVALARIEPDGAIGWFQGFVDLQDLPFDPFDPHLDRTGLDIGGFYERHPQVNDLAVGVVYREADLARELHDRWFAPATGSGRDRKAILYGAVPNFDELCVADMMIRHELIDSEAPYHYQLQDVETLAAGRLRLGPPPWDSRALSRRLGVDPGAYAHHTALGDVEWALEVLRRATGPWWRLWAARVRPERT
ncbi:hypothetical protein [Microbispora sp. NPDC049125]|uniref:hypothetical protein n=1 Tax=Microbispora sp. NPDC049125 TaxID=3154929 RepID=UPI003466F721